MDPKGLPRDLPIPVDDGAADGLEGRQLPATSLPSCLGGAIDIRQAAQDTLVLYVYPRTGIPGQPLPAGWDAIPGARGCTLENCAFRDLESDLRACGARLIGLSAQSSAQQCAFAARELIRYPLLSDPDLRLAGELGLPTFEAAGLRLYRRLTLIAVAGVVSKVFYPVYPPDHHPQQVLDWLRERPM